MGDIDMTPSPGGRSSTRPGTRCAASTRRTAPAAIAENRATLHLHGGNTPWISTARPAVDHAGRRVHAVARRASASRTSPTWPECPAPTARETFYYTNQQSARLLFYHDHAWGITRLNVYAGEAAGYLHDRSPPSRSWRHRRPPDGGATIPLVIQDKTFVPDASRSSTQQDPTWNKARWGGAGQPLVPHVYMPAQNPGDPSGMSAFGRWMYGPWFWPPARDAKYGPDRQPVLRPDLQPGRSGHLAVPDRPVLRARADPGHAEHLGRDGAFNDTPIVNGTAYPTVTLDRRPTASGSSTPRTTASSTSSGTWPTRPPPGQPRSR